MVPNSPGSVDIPPKLLQPRRHGSHPQDSAQTAEGKDLMNIAKVIGLLSSHRGLLPVPDGRSDDCLEQRAWAHVVVRWALRGCK